MRPLLATFLLTASPCWHLPMRSAAAEPVRVESLTGNFPSPEKGELHLRLAVHNPHARQGAMREVGWEVWLNGRWFAAGVSQVTGPLPGHGDRTVELTLPLTYRRTRRTATDAPLEIGLRGQVRTDFEGLGGGLEGLVFSAALVQPLPGAPLPSVEDDEG